jgi:hypothetical protein
MHKLVGRVDLAFFPYLLFGYRFPVVEHPHTTHTHTHTQHTQHTTHTQHVCTVGGFLLTL